MDPPGEGRETEEDEKTMDSGAAAPEQPTLRRDPCYSVPSRPGAFHMPNNNNTTTAMTSLSETAEQRQQQPDPFEHNGDRDDDDDDDEQHPDPPFLPTTTIPSQGLLSQPASSLTHHTSSELTTTGMVTLTAEPVDEQLEAARLDLIRAQTRRMEELEQLRETERRELETERREREVERLERHAERLEHQRQEIELDKARLRERERVLALEMELQQMRARALQTTAAIILADDDETPTTSTIAGATTDITPAAVISRVIANSDDGSGHYDLEAAASRPATVPAAVEGQEQARRYPQHSTSEQQQQQVTATRLSAGAADVEQAVGSGASDDNDRRDQGGGDSTIHCSRRQWYKRKSSYAGILLLLVLTAVAVVVGVVVAGTSSNSRGALEPTTSPSTMVPTRTPPTTPPLSTKAPTSSSPTKSPTTPPLISTTAPTSSPTPAPVVVLPDQPVQPALDDETNNNNNTWQQVGSALNGEAPGDYFGASLAINGDGTIVAAGATWNDGIAGAESGHARVFQLTNGDWKQLGDDLDGEASFDNAGFAVALSKSGKIVAVGARFNRGAQGLASGHVRVYQMDEVANQWIQLGNDVDGQASSDQSGYDVDLSADGKTLVVGAIFGTDTNSGHVRVFQFDALANQWTQLGSDLNGEAAGDFFGWSVSISATAPWIVAAGGTANDDQGSNAGHVRAFQYDADTNEWFQLGDDLDGEAAGDSFGHGVALDDSGTILAAGGTSHDLVGHVRVFQFSEEDATWNRLGSDVDGAVSGDKLGFSVSLSQNGMTLAVGAPFNDNNGRDSGHAKVYEFDSVKGDWEQIGVDLEGAAASDYFGGSVALDDSGKIMAVGAERNGDNGELAGQVQVFQRNDTGA